MISFLVADLFPMARTVDSVRRRGEGRDERGGGGKVRNGRGRVEAREGLEGRKENLGDGREENLGEGREENLGEGREGSGGNGGGKRVRKGTTHFQFGNEHTLYSETSAKYKKKTVAVEKNREKRRQNYKKVHFGDLKRKVQELKSLVRQQAIQLKAQSRKDMKRKTRK